MKKKSIFIWCSNSDRSLNHKKEIQDFQSRTEFQPRLNCVELIIILIINNIKINKLNAQNLVILIKII